MEYINNVCFRRKEEVGKTYTLYLPFSAWIIKTNL
jgi:hypothetical protein